MSFEEIYPLPSNWVWITSEEACESVRDGTHDTPTYIDEGIPLATSKNLLPTGLDLENTKNISWEEHLKISQRSGVEEGDILFGMIGTIGNPVIVQTTEPFSIKNGNYSPPVQKG